MNEDTAYLKQGYVVLCCTVKDFLWKVMMSYFAFFHGSP
jgi:hypothetical protein